MFTETCSQKGKSSYRMYCDDSILLVFNFDMLHSQWGCQSTVIYMLNPVSWSSESIWAVTVGRIFVCLQNLPLLSIFDRSGIQTMRWVTSVVQLEVRILGQNVTSFSWRRWRRLLYWSKISLWDWKGLVLMLPEAIAESYGVMWKNLLFSKFVYF